MLNRNLKILLLTIVTISNAQSEYDNKKKYNKKLKYPHQAYNYKKINVAQISSIYPINNSNKKSIDESVSRFMGFKNIIPDYLYYQFEISKYKSNYTCNDLNKGLYKGLSYSNVLTKLVSMKYCLEVNCKDYSTKIDKDCLRYYFSFKPAAVTYFLYVPSDRDSPDGWDGLSLNELLRDIRKNRKVLSESLFHQYFAKHIKMYIGRIDHAIRASKVQKDINYLKSISKELSNMLKACNHKFCDIKKI